MATHEQQLEVQPAGTGLGSVGDIDQQIATARRYPRSVVAFARQATEYATMNREIAASCIYALPRKDDDGTKTIEGPSARFAEIIASAWGNLRAIGRVGDHDGQFVTARGEAWDVEKNVAIAYEVKRRITGRSGRTYSADLIMTTGNAAASIALRNAILKVVPTTFWKPVYNACRLVIAGDQKTFATRRDAALHEFAVMGVTEDRILAALGLRGKGDITGDHLVALAGIRTAIKDGDTTIEDAFDMNAPAASQPQPGQRRSQQGAAGSTDGAKDRGDAETRSREMPSAAAGTVGGPAPSVGDRPAHIGQIVEVKEGTNGAAVVILSTGFTAGTRTEEYITGAKRHQASKATVELVTNPPMKAGNLPSITEIRPVTVAAAGVGVE
jgi:hypothetical protein